MFVIIVLDEAFVHFLFCVYIQEDMEIQIIKRKESYAPFVRQLYSWPNSSVPNRVILKVSAIIRQETLTVTVLKKC